MSTCSIADSLQAAMDTFRFEYSNKTAALVAKINKERLEIELGSVDDYDSFEDMVEALALPETTPRYLLISYEHVSDRVQYPLCMIYYNPPSKAELNMLYASNSVMMSSKAGIGSRIVELRNGDDLTKEWLSGQLRK